MKKLLLLIQLILLLFSGLAQPPIVRSTDNNTVYDVRWGAQKNALMPTYDDTTQANLPANIGLDSIGAVIYTNDVGGLWVRVSPPKRWQRVGNLTSLLSSSSVLVSGTGDATDPYIPSVIRSAQANNAFQIFPDGVFVPSQVQNGLIDGGKVIHRTGLTYTVQAAIYAINGVVYTSPETDVTLPAADSDDRIDGFVVTTAGTAISLTGTPDPSNPQNPSYDPATQLPLTFVVVQAASTEPAFCRDSIYYPNNGNTWLAVPSTVTRINVAATTDPYSVTQHIQLTAAQNNDKLRMEKGSTINFSTYSVMAIRIKSGAAWASTTRLEFQAYNLLTPLGTAVIVGDGTPYGFNSTNLAGYQTVIVPIQNLGSNIATANTIVMTVKTTGANTITARIDDWELLGCDGTPPPTTGSFWNTTGNQEGRTLFGGTLDNNVVQFLANNLNHTQLKTDGTTWMQGTNPGISFFLGTFAAADYYIRRVSNTVTLNVASGAIIDHTIQGTSMYNISGANGHIFRNSSGTFGMQLNSTNQLLIGSNSATASNLVALNSTTQALRLTNQTATQMNAIANDAGMITYNTTAQLPYYNNGSAWLPIGTSVTASNGLTMSTATNVELGGTLNKTTTINTAGFTTAWTGTASSTISITNSTVGGKGILISTQGMGIDITATNSAALQGVSTTSSAIIGFVTTASTYGVQANGNFSSTNTIAPLILMQRSTSGTAANSIGTAIEFQVEKNNGSLTQTNLIQSKWSNASNGAEHSQLQIIGTNTAVTGNTIATFDGAGVVGIGVTTGFVGSRLDARDNSIASGHMVNFSSTSSSYGTNQGRLVNIDFSGANTNSSQITFGERISNTRTGTTATNVGLHVVASGGTFNTGIEVRTFATAGSVGIHIISDAGAIYGESNNAGGGSTAASFVGNSGNQALVAQSYDGETFQLTRINEGGGTESDVETVGNIMRVATNGTVSGNGLGAALAWILYDNTGDGEVTGKIIHELTDATPGTGLQSQWRFQVKDNDITNVFTDVLKIDHDGVVTLGEAYQGLGAGILQVSNTGVVSWGAGSGALTNPMTTTGDIIVSADNSGTPARLGIGSSGQVLTVVAGTPAWTTVTGTGSVTTVSVATANGFAGSVASATTTPVITISTTITGLLKGNGTAISAAVSGTDYLPITGGTSIANVGTITTGTWQGTTVGPTFGGTGQTSWTAGQLLVATATNTLGKINPGTTGQVLTMNAGGAPVWSNPTAGGTVTTFGFTNANGFTGSVSNPTTTPSLTLGTSITGMISGNGTSLVAVTSSTVGQVLRVTGANSFAFGQIDLANTNAVTGLLPTANGSTGFSGSTAGGQLLMGNGSGGWNRNTISGTANQINVVNGAGTITISHAFNPTEQTLTSGAVITWNMTNGGNAFLLLNNTGATLAQPTGVVAGYTYTLYIQQGSGGGRTISTWTNVHWSGGTLPTLQTTAGKVDVVRLYARTTTFFVGTLIPDVQ